MQTQEKKPIATALPLNNNNERLVRLIVNMRLMNVFEQHASWLLLLLASAKKMIQIQWSFPFSSLVIAEIISLGSSTPKVTQVHKSEKMNEQMLFKDVYCNQWIFKTEFTRGPGRGDTCHLSIFDETLPGWRYYPVTLKD